MHQSTPVQVTHLLKVLGVGDNGFEWLLQIYSILQLRDTVAEFNFDLEDLVEHITVNKAKQFDLLTHVVG
jgi:hypothetical protein